MTRVGSQRHSKNKNYVVLCIVCICVLYYCHRVATPLAVKYIISFAVVVLLVVHKESSQFVSTTKHFPV